MQWRFPYDNPHLLRRFSRSGAAPFPHFFGTSTEKITINPMDYAPYLDDFHS